jgi:2-amino-4-hydroxy-6-hydroxymethyldihydropteridine diphosphokinase
MTQLQQVFVGLGANLQDPAAQVRRAFDELAHLPQTRLIRASSLYESEALQSADALMEAGKTPPRYINAVAALETMLTPQVLLEEMMEIEQQHGRMRLRRWDSRTLDLDLLVYGQQNIDEPGLRVPHPEMHKRAFVLYPLHEIAPELEIPGLGPLATLLSHCDAGEIRKLAI